MQDEHGLKAITEGMAAGGQVEILGIREWERSSEMGLMDMCNLEWTPERV